MTSWPHSSGQTAERQAGQPGVRPPAAAQQPALGYPDGPNPGKPPGPSLRGQTLPGIRTTTPSNVSRTGGYLSVVSRRVARRVPTRGGLLRRRLMITASKFLLPALALLLLSSIA